ncbi:hypothetical protein yc1106_10125 [Curvularia clavata]|uniref:Uncharacterized protein n=1 Tax=Curvularia clavata TaxID=95742 RepID=A0A9Q9DYP6_CURCL|nr:hypothetical protein yc1106_10125 [Curvularia clavata]
MAKSCHVNETGARAAQGASGQTNRAKRVFHYETLDVEIQGIPSLSEDREAGKIQLEGETCQILKEFELSRTTIKMLLQSTSLFNFWSRSDTSINLDLDMDSVNFSDFDLASPERTKASNPATTLFRKGMISNPLCDLGIGECYGTETTIGDGQPPLVAATPPQPNLGLLAETTGESIENGQWLSTLAELNVKLFSHAKSMREHACVPDQGAQSLYASSAMLDDALGLFLQFVGLLRHRTVASRTPSSSSSIDGSSTSTSASNGFGSDAASLSIAADHGSVLMMLSCYIRILETCTKILTAIKAALATGFSSHARSVPVLRLSIGSNALEYPLIRLRVIMELIESLLDSMRACLAPNTEASSGRPQQFDQLMKAPWDRCTFRQQPQLPEQANPCHLQEEKVFDLIRTIRIDLKQLQGDSVVALGLGLDTS